MDDALINSELQKCWSQLTVIQQHALINVVKCFMRDGEEAISGQYNQQLQEEEAVYQVRTGGLQEETLKQLNGVQKKSILLMIKTFLQSEDQDFGPITIEQYNREIDEAMKRMDAGEFISQEDLEKDADQW